MKLDYDRSIESQNVPVPFPSRGSDFEQLKWRLAFDIRWVCMTLLKITDKDTNRLQDFVFNRVQLWVYWNMLDQWRSGEPVRLWILKGRQLGISTFFSAVLFIMAAFWDRNCLQVAQDEQKGKRMLAKVDRFFNNFPKKVRDGAAMKLLLPDPQTRLRGHIIQWESKEKQALIVSESGQDEDVGVSETFQAAHFTEGPLWKDMEAAMGGFMPTMPATDPSSLLVGEFTARGEGDYSHATWVNCMAGQSWARGLFLPWYWYSMYADTPPEDWRPARWMVELRRQVAKVGYAYPLEHGSMRLKPEFAKIRKKRPLLPQDLATGFTLTDAQLYWLGGELKKNNGDFDVLFREYPHTPEVAFQTSGRRLIPPQVMDRIDQKGAEFELLDTGEYEPRRGAGGRTRRVYARRDGSMGSVWRWKEPEADELYIIDADTSSGVSRDYSAAHVLRVRPGEIMVVASFQKKVRPPDFAAILSRMGSHYRSHAEWSDVNEGRIKSRSGVPSLIVVERNNHGEHVIYELAENLRYRRLYRHGTAGTTDQFKLDHRYGFPTSWTSKMPMLINLQQVAYDGGLIIPCSRTRQEMRNIIYLDELDERAGAPKGANDDLAMALGIGVLIASKRSGFKSALRRANRESNASAGMMLPVVGR